MWSTSGRMSQRASWWDSSLAPTGQASYSRFVGDILGAALVAEGIFFFFFFLIFGERFRLWSLTARSWALRVAASLRRLFKVNELSRRDH